MELKIALLGALVFAASALLTGIVRRVALSSGLVDLPNSRSSHNRSTARGGGLSVVFATIVGVIALAITGVVSKHLLVAIAIGGGMVALVGFLDDRYSVRPGVRFVVHAGAAFWALIWLGGLPPLLFSDHLIQLGAIGYLIGVLGIVWALNLSNFMDGIDGIAASEAVFVAGAGALLSAGGRAGVTDAAAVFACACAGFLIWNWPPAKIFLGDVGSGYLGYVIAILALAATRESPIALWAWLILGGVFFVDATVTLLRRLLRGERVYEAHRTHAYQWLARRWGSHAKVTCAVQMVNVLWLLPCAVLATRRPSLAAATVIFAFAPLVLVAIATSGRREANDRRRGQR